MELHKTQWHAFLWSLPFPAYIHDGDNALVSANAAFLALVGQEWSAVQGQPYWAVLGLSGPVTGCTESMPGGKWSRTEAPIGAASYAIYCAPLQTTSEAIYGGHLLVDVTREGHEGERLRLTMRALSLTDLANQAQLYAESEADLLKRFCTLITDPDAFGIGWIALCDDADCTTLTLQCIQGEEAAAKAGQTLARDAADQGERAFLEAVLGQGQMVVSGSSQPGETEGPWPEVLVGYPAGKSLAVPILVQGRRVGVLGLQVPEETALDAEVVRLFKELTSDLGLGLSSQRSQVAYKQAREDLETALVGTVHAVGRLVEERDPYTAGHQRRVAELAMALGRALGLDSERLRGLDMGAQIHDLGKVKVPTDILNKPGRLSDTEMTLVREHALTGAAIVGDQPFPWPIADMVRHHHERLDGSGYPDGLSGEAISLEARILAVADIVEAMTSHRPYRPGLGLETALAQIEADRGTKLDVLVVDHCLALFREGRFAFSA